MALIHSKALVLVGLVVVAGRATAQTDYRNLDGDRPTFIADAYPIERWAFELSMPWRFEQSSTGPHAHILAPEIAYGLFRNGQVGLGLPFAGVNRGMSTEWGLAGLHAFGLYNFNTESSWPALSVRTDLSLPVGSNAGNAARFGASVFATRSFGAQRIHVNAGGAVGPDDREGGVESIPRWSLGAALDRTFIRESLLLIAELYAKQHGGDDPTEAIASLGARWQISPTFVIDGGVGRRLSSAGPDLTVTIGLSHSFAVSSLLPTVRGGPAVGGPR